MTEGSIPKRWFSNKRAIDEMMVYTEKGLKIWEKDVISKYFPINSKILDIGCGMGREAFLLHDLGYKLLGIDISEEVILEAQTRAKESQRKVQFICTDGETLPFDDELFDVVIIWSQTLGLLYGEEKQTQLLKRCKRVLRDNGIISFSGHDLKYISQNHKDCIVDDKFYPFANSDVYWDMFTPERMLKLAGNVGFHVLECGNGELHTPEDGVILHCIAKK